jgi:Tat protein translocase TatC
MPDDTLNSIRSSLFTVLKEIQREGRKVALAFLIGFLSTIIGLRVFAWSFFESVMRSGMSEELSQEVSIIAQTPFEVLLIQAKIGLFIGIASIFPVFIYILRKRFIVSSTDENRTIPWYAYIITIFVGFTLFIGGLWYSYFVFFPIVFEFLASATVQTGVEPMYSISRWTQFMILLSLSFGILSQVPVSIPALVRYEIISYESVLEGFRYWIFGTLCLGAILSPPEPISQLMWAGPLIGLYGSAIIISSVINPSTKETNSGTSKESNQDVKKTESDNITGTSESNPIENITFDNNYQKLAYIGKRLKNNSLILMGTFLLTGIISFYAQFAGLTEYSIDIITNSISGYSDLSIVALHPVELLMFQAKVSVVIALIPTIFIALFRIWPNIRSDGLVKISRTNMISFIIVPIITLIVGFIIGLIYITPEILELLIADAGRIDAQISYQIKNFFWIVLYTAILSTLFISVYLTIIYWYFRGLRTTIFTDYWRQIILGVLIFSMFITPNSITKSLLFMSIPTLSLLLAVGTINIIERIKSYIPTN